MKLLALPLFALALAGAAPFQPPEKGTRTVYRHAILIDPTAKAPRSDMAVITDGERIAAERPVSEDVHQVEGRHRRTQGIARTTPPSTRSAAPVVAEARSLHT